MEDIPSDMLKPKGKAVKLHVWRQFKVCGQELEATTLKNEEKAQYARVPQKERSYCSWNKRILLLQKHPQP